jgi:hypothetical protein
MELYTAAPVFPGKSSEASRAETRRVQYADFNQFGFVSA